MKDPVLKFNITEQGGSGAPKEGRSQKGMLHTRRVASQARTAIQYRW